MRQQVVLIGQVKEVVEDHSSIPQLDSVIMHLQIKLVNNQHQHPTKLRTRSEKSHLNLINNILSVWEEMT